MVQQARFGAGVVAPRAGALLLQACARRPRAVQLLTALALSADPADPAGPADPADAGADEVPYNIHLTSMFRAYILQ